MGKKWLPLESNPEVMTEFAERIGLDTTQHAFYDVLGLDEELLAMVPQPVAAVLLLYPITSDTEAAAKADDERLAAEGAAAGHPGGVYYLKQTIGNACGTIAMLHAFGNNLGAVKLAEGSFLSRFFESTKAMTPQQRGAFLEEPPSGAPDIEEAHQAASERGDTAPPALDEVVDLHFVAFVNVEGQLMELDGRRAGPVSHGPTTADSLLADAARVVRRQFIERSNSINFNLITLSKAEDS
ncbi:MAG: peptidase C12, ubiquitin carboxyl-terminal hydrolase 1 [Monoraphidium minutum]|nr:MAG: peptidase C12, ubiquitin carboxyl-terminal hydrolase 1 [Monoraphidium minutum]